MAKYLSGKSKKRPQSQLDNDRNRYLSVDQAEPNLGDPTLLDIESNIPIGPQYQIISVIGRPGERYWIPRGGGLIPGAITVYDENIIVPNNSGISSITQLNFEGDAIRAEGYTNADGSPGIGVTITVFAPGSQGQFIINNNNDFAGVSSIFYDVSTNYIGIGTNVPTEILDVNGDIRLRASIYDWNNQPGNTGDLIRKNADGGITWVPPGAFQSGAGGTIGQIQYHSNIGLVDGAEIFYYDYVNNRVGIGSTQPRYLLDVLGISSFRGTTNIDNLNVTNLGTIKDVTVNNITTLKGSVDAEIGASLNDIRIGISNSNRIDTSSGNLVLDSSSGRVIVDDDLIVTGITSVGFITTRNAYVSGILTAINLDFFNTAISFLTVGVVTVTSQLNATRINATGITTLRDLNVIQDATFQDGVTINELTVTGFANVDNLNFNGNTISASNGNLVLDSVSGNVVSSDLIRFDNATESTSTNSGSVILSGGLAVKKNVNIAGNINISGSTNLASSGGITTTGGDLYVKGDLYVLDSLVYDNFSANTGEVKQYLKTKDFEATGISTLSNTDIKGTLGVVGATALNNTLTVSGNTTLNNTLTVSGTTTLNGDLDLGNASTDTVTFTSRVDSSILPSANDAYDFGSSLLRWKDIYATNINISTKLTAVDLEIVEDLFVSGKIVPSVGNSSDKGIFWPQDPGGGSGDQAFIRYYVETGENTRLHIGIKNDADDDIYLESSQVITSGGLAVSGTATLNGDVDLGNASTDTVTFTGRVDSDILPSVNNAYDLGSSAHKWNQVYATEFVGQVVGNADSATKLLTARNFSISGDVDAPSVAFDGTGNVNLVTTLDNSGVTAGTYGSSTVIPVFSVDAKGRVTSVTNTGVNFATATVAQSDAVRAVSRDTNATHFLTFVDSNNSTGAYEFLYTDAGITYNPSTNDISISGGLTVGGAAILNNSLTVAGTAVLNGDVDLGNASTDTVTFTGRVDSDILPSTDNTRDLGSSSLKWNQVYATEFVGQVVGNADSATKLATARNFSISGDVDAPSVAFDGTGNVNLVTTLDNSGVVAGTYGSSTAVPVFNVDAKGRVTSVTNTGINFATATVAQSDAIKTVSRSTDATHFLTFVDSNNSTANYESLYTDDSITYNPSTNSLTSGNAIVNGTLTVAGTATLNGDVDLGNATTDTVTFTGRVDSDVLPSTNDTRDLGSSSLRWKSIYATTINVATSISTLDQTINGDLTVTGVITPSVGNSSDNGIFWPQDPGGGSGDQAFIRYYAETGENTRLHIGIRNDADDDIYLESSQVTTSGALTVSGTAVLNGDVDLGNASTDTVTFTGRVDSDILPSTDNTRDLGSSTLKWNQVYATEFVGQIKGKADSADIATNLANGAAGSLPYQTAANVTAFLADPNASDRVLTYNNSTNAPEWSVLSNLAGAGYTLDAVDSGNDVILRLSDGTTSDDVKITAGANITINPVAAGGFTISAVLPSAPTDVASLSDSEGSLVPTGTVITYAGATAPTGYLAANGASLNTYTYRELHAVLSNRYGGTAYLNGVTNVPGASGNFTLPDLRNRFVTGSGSSYALGATGGSDSVTLQSNQIPSHTHPFTGSVAGDGSHSHTISGSATGGTHVHTYLRTKVGNAPKSRDQGELNAAVNRGADNVAVDGNGSHTHTISGTASGGSHSHTVGGSASANSGGGGAHENRPPYIALLRCIKYT